MKNLKKSVSAATAAAAVCACALVSTTPNVKSVEIENNKSFLSSNNMMCLNLDLENALNNNSINNTNINPLLANTAENSDIAVDVFDKKMYATTTVNIRREANKKGEIVGKLKFGDKIKVSKTNANTKWVKVLYKNEVAYVYGEYLSTKKPQPPVNSYTDSDLSLLAHLIYAECGSSWCCDQMLYYAGSVVLNRVKSDKFPNTLHDVIYAKGQYAPTWNGAINKTPDERAWEIAEELLREGSVLPANVVFQAEFTQGSGTYAKVQNEYFCYY